MSSFYDEPDQYDDGEFITVRYNDILRENHPARLIKKFVSTLDITAFEERYKVGQGNKGRPPKGIKMMLGIILYALYERIYSAHDIDKATYSYSDFWIFSHKKRVSHDKISDFVNMHEEEMKDVFLETILLADSNKLLSFESLYQDGFFIKANASKEKNYTLERLDKKENRIREALDNIFAKLKEDEIAPETIKEKENLEKKLKKISELKVELNQKIKNRLEGKRPDKIKDKLDKMTINSTDEDSNVMKMKDGSYANAYLKINAVDSKADIVVGSSVHGHFDESHNAVKLFKEANKNCSKTGEQYKSVCFDSGFNTLGSCVSFEAMGVEVISPTKQYENETRYPEKHEGKITYQYDDKKHCVICSEGAILTEQSRYESENKGTVFYKFWNKEKCKCCDRRPECTKNKKGYFEALVDARQPYQQRVLDRYKSKKGQELYKKRMHTAETYQGDLKQNGKFERFYKRGMPKVYLESILQDVVWNLRRIFNATGYEIVW